MNLPLGAGAPVISQETQPNFREKVATHPRTLKPSSIPDSPPSPREFTRSTRKIAPAAQITRYSIANIPQFPAIPSAAASRTMGASNWKLFASFQLRTPSFEGLSSCSACSKLRALAILSADKAATTGMGNEKEVVRIFLGVLVSYVSPLLAVAVAMGLRLALEAWLGPGLPPYITFYPAILTTAALQGFWAGIFTNLLSAVSVVYWILPHAGPGCIGEPIQRAALWLFICMGLLTSLVAERYKRFASAHAREVEELGSLLKELKDLRAALNEHSIVAITDTKGKITFVNDKFCKISKYSRHELLGQDHRIINSRFHSKEFIRGLWTEITHGQVWKGEIKNRAKDGSFYWVDTTIVPILNTEGKPLQYIAIRSDITERKQMVEWELFRVEERWRYILDISGLGAWELNLLNQDAWRSPRHDQIFGYSELLPEWSYTMFLTHVHPQDRDMVDAAFKEKLASGRDWHFEYRIVRVDQEVRWILARGRIFKDQQGRSDRMLGTIDDITERRLEEQELKRMVMELKQTNSDLEQFAYVASHDLQEPLRAVAGCIEILDSNYRDKLGPEAGELIRHTVDGAKRMQTLINDLLAYSRIGKNGQHFEPTDCNAMLDEAIANLSTAVQKSGAIITHDPLPTLIADCKQLPQLFQNLLANGIKFCAGRTPEIHVSAQLQAHTWRFSVQDNGIGIEAQYLDRIFVIFRRLHTRAEYPGTGIGLAICKRIVERHHGRIWVESAPGKGSTFYFTIPEKSGQTS